MATKILAGRYEVLAKIGEGGMAVVYKAKDRKLNRQVAIKVLRPEFVKDESFVESFRRESYAAARLQHPNIVSVYDVGKEGNIYFIVMELVVGKTLSELIAERGSLDFKETIRIAKQVASALSLAHKNSIVHRDVKPHNILVNADGLAKITDFGIARAVSDGTIVSDQGSIMGSVHYFSPEQGRGGYVDEKTDIYSLGIVIFEMLTGKVPFDADNAVAIAMMHMKDAIPAPSSIVPGVPPGLDQIVLKATEKYQTDRFKTIDEMYDALNNVNFVTGVIDDPNALSYTRRNLDAPKSIKPNDIKAGGVLISDRDLKNYGQQDDYPRSNLGEKVNNGSSYGGAGNPGESGSISNSKEGDSRGNNAAKSAGKAVGGGVNALGSAGASALKSAVGNGKNNKNNKKGKKTKEQKVQRRNIVLAVVIAIVLALSAGFGIFKLYTVLSATKTVPVPELIGLTIEEATVKVSDAGLKLKEADEVESDTYEAGKIAYQDPKKGTEVKKGRTIEVSVSKGAAVVMGTVPDLVGRSKVDAEKLAKADGYELAEPIYMDSEKDYDTVLKQSPESGKDLEKGGQITLTLSQGKKSNDVKVPSIINMTIDEARAALEGVGLVLGDVQPEHSSAYEEGRIMYQSIKADDVVNEGQTISGKVSSGPEEVEGTVSITIPFKDAPSEVFTVTALQISSDGTQTDIYRDKSFNAEDEKTTISVTGKGLGKVQVFFSGTLYKTYDIDFTNGTYTEA
ncbi:MAG: protein kinase [Clostridiales Family XIII bacterium]|jgi:serine/threonine-protein kinase|nr:protein kinase [Clostridiales Family XIII bacterium]